jgi:hypothetical protein
MLPNGLFIKLNDFFLFWCTIGIHGSVPFCGSILVTSVKSLQLIAREGTPVPLKKAKNILRYLLFSELQKVRK